MSRDHFREQLLKELDLLQSRVERLEFVNTALRRLSVAPNLESLGRFSRRASGVLCHLMFHLSLC